MREAQAQAEVRTVGFVFVSSVLHVALAIGILALKAQQTPPKDMVEIEILGHSSISAAASSSIPMPLPGALPKAAPVSAAPKVAAKSQAVVPAAQKITSVQQTQSPVVDVNESVNAPLEAPDLDEPKNISAAPQQELNTEEFSKDLDQVDQESNVKVEALQKNLNSETDEALKEHETQTQQLKAQTATESAALAKQIEQTKSEAQVQQALLAKADAEREARAQASAEQSAAAQVAAEQTQADQIAAAKAAKLASEKAQADQVAAAKAAAEQAALTKASEERMLAAKAAADQAQADRLAAQNAAMTAAAAKKAQASAGNDSNVNNEVRSLNELRQVPGNEHPAYDSEDRLKGRQGDVAFLAYISREGQPVKFKMVQSSGFRELDAKTLKAIRSWKFYPGQEGWVEIPFRWDLKGGPQEMPATLRRKISQF